jgi:transposase
VADAYRRAVARSAGKIRQVDDGVPTLQTLEYSRHLGGCGNGSGPNDGGQSISQHRLNDRSGPRLSRRRKRGTREQAFGRSRGGFTCKVHCLSDATGLPLAFQLTGGEAADCTQFETLSALAEARPGYLIADKGYDSDAIRDSLREAGVRPVIPPRSNRKTTIRWNKRVYRQRNRIERLIGHLKINRAIATRYDKLAQSFLDMLHLAALRRLLRHATL